MGLFGKKTTTSKPAPKASSKDKTAAPRSKVSPASTSKHHSSSQPSTKSKVVAAPIKGSSGQTSLLGGHLKAHHSSHATSKSHSSNGAVAPNPKLSAFRAHPKTHSGSQPPPSSQTMSSAGSSKTAGAPVSAADKKKAAAERQKAAREKGGAIKQIQEAALKALPTNKLYVVLYIRDDPPTPGDFHWGYYYHKSSHGGTKYHVKNMSSGWIADHGPTGGVFKSQFLCVLIEIGTIHPSHEGLLDQNMRSYDNYLNSHPNFDCIQWTFSILQKLIQAGLLTCNNLQAFRQECVNYGNENLASAARNDQPRPIRVSQICR